MRESDDDFEKGLRAMAELLSQNAWRVTGMLAEMRADPKADADFQRFMAKVLHG